MELAGPFEDLQAQFKSYKLPHDDPTPLAMTMTNSSAILAITKPPSR
jgi:hypothetical protein